MRLPLTLALSPFAPKWRDGERGSGRAPYFAVIPMASVYSSVRGTILRALRVAQTLSW